MPAHQQGHDELREAEAAAVARRQRDRAHGLARHGDLATGHHGQRGVALRAGGGGTDVSRCGVY